jgi:hypothetical protein
MPICTCMGRAMGRRRLDIQAVALVGEVSLKVDTRNQTTHWTISGANSARHARSKAYALRQMR